MDKYEKSSLLLNHYHNEWLHRHSHFWKILAYLSVANLIIICFPICCSYFDVNINRFEISPKIFPVIGMVFAIVGCILFLIESKKLINLRKNINEQLMIINNQKPKSLKRISFVGFVIKYINFIITVMIFVSMCVIAVSVMLIL